MNDNYVRFDLYWESPIDNILLQSGKYIFRDSNLQLHDFGAIYYVLRYVTNYNLNDLELFLRLNGFSAFSNDEMMNEYSHAYTFSLNKNNNIAHFCTEEEAIKEIKSKFGSKSIENFKEFKILQYERKIQNLQTEINELKKEKERFNKSLKLTL